MAYCLLIVFLTAYHMLMPMTWAKPRPWETWDARARSPDQGKPMGPMGPGAGHGELVCWCAGNRAQPMYEARES